MCATRMSRRLLLFLCIVCEGRWWDERDKIVAVDDDEVI
jgi:hypothetical protein